MSIRVVLNWDNKNEEFHLIKNLKKNNYTVFQYSLDNFNPVKFKSLKGKLELFYKYFLGAYKAVIESKNGDVLIGTNFHVGALISILCLILRKKNKVIGFNLILNDKSWFVNKVRGFFLYFTFMNKNFYTTINNNYLIDLYSKYFIKIIPKERFFILKDHYINPKNLEESKEDKNYVFTGGENSRDWDTLFKAAKILPNISFICVARKRLFPKIGVPGNVQMYFDISYIKFIDFLKKSSIVAMPLLSEGPAGLLVIFDATFLGKPIITTNTIITANYIQNNESGVLIKNKDYRSLAKNIQDLIKDKEKSKKFSKKLKNKLENEYSAESYADKVLNIIKSVK